MSETMKSGRILGASVLAVSALSLAAPAGAFALGNIAGTVTAEGGGAPVGDYAVAAYPAGGTSPEEVTCTQANGTFNLLVPPGLYEVYFAGTAIDPTCTVDTLYAPEWFDSRTTRTFAEHVAVTDNAATANVNATLRAGATINGKVTNASTAANLQNVTVDLLRVDLNPLQTTCTAADGTYSLTRIPEDVYTVRFNAQGSCGNAGNFATEWWEDSLTQAGAMAESPAPGQVLNDINAALVPPTPPTPGVTLTVNKSGSGNGTVTSTAPGINCGSVCSALFGVNSVVGLVATPGSGSTFSGWSGAGCSGTGACTVSMTADQATTATFTTAGSGGPDGSCDEARAALAEAQAKLKKAKKRLKKAKLSGDEAAIKKAKKKVGKAKDVVRKAQSLVDSAC